MTRGLLHAMRFLAVCAFLLGSWGCSDASNEKDITATSGPGSAPPGAKANSEEMPPPPPGK